MWSYTPKMMEYFKNPRNVGEIENPDAVGEVGNIICGDALRIYLRIDRKTEKILDAKFKTFGCASAIASSSALTEMIIGKTLTEASKITNQDVADFLGGLPNEKMHCSVMCMEALEKAIANYRGTSVTKQNSSHENIICKCFGVSDEKILRAIKENNLHTVSEVTHYTKAGGGCGHCKEDIQKLIDEFWAKTDSKKVKIKENQNVKLTNIQRIKLIEEAIETHIRPMLKADGGNLEVFDIDRNKVYVKFSGRCLSCPSSNATLKSFIEVKLREFVSDDIIVEEVR